MLAIITKMTLTQVGLLLMMFVMLSITGKMTLTQVVQAQLPTTAHLSSLGPTINRQAPEWQEEAPPLSLNFTFSSKTNGKLTLPLAATYCHLLIVFSIRCRKLINNRTLSFSAVTLIVF